MFAVAVAALLVSAALLITGATFGLRDLSLLIALPTVTAAIYLLWSAEPAYTLSAAIFLTPFAGNWQYLSFPHGLDPDRILLTLGILQVLFRAPAVRDRPRFRLTSAHVLLTLALAYVVLSAYAAHTLTQKDPFFKIIDAFGLLPFLTFLVAPLAFRTKRQRAVLLVTLVSMGLYLGLTTLFDAVHLDALVFPTYILDPNIGIHFGRGRGPFLDAVANGFALFVCAAACGVAVRNWSRPGAKLIAVFIALVCLAGAFLSLERSVWIGAVAGIIISMATTSWLRPYLLPVLATTAIALGGAFALIPSLDQSVNKRLNQVSSVWDRQNLTVAGLNMFEARPLTGFGWQTFQADSRLYFRRSQNYPLTAVGFGIHNFPLSYLVELGMPGFVLWIAGVVLGVGGALLTRGPPDLAAWRAGLIAVVVMFISVAFSVPPTLFPNLALWLWAGVVFSGRYAELRPTGPPMSPGQEDPPMPTISGDASPQRRLDPQVGAFARAMRMRGSRSPAGDRARGCLP